MRKLIDVLGFLTLFLTTLQWGSFAFLSQLGCGGNTSVDLGESSGVTLDDPADSSSDSTDSTTDSTDDSTDEDAASTTSESAPMTYEIFGTMPEDAVTQPDEFTVLLDCLGLDSDDGTAEYMESTCGDTADAITQTYYCRDGIGYRENGGNDEELFEITEMSCTVDSDGVYTIAEDELIVS